MLYNDKVILGIDEVGRGPWAGPLVVGAVVLGDNAIDGLTDSKKLTKKRRDELDIIIREQASGYGLGWVSASEIDEIGLSSALVLATKRAVEQVKCRYTEIIIDGTVNFLADTNKGPYVTTLKKADLLIQSVSAASIIAKVARDNYMAKQDGIYPGYKFASHVGYGTASHQTAIAEHGITPLHRMSFAPIQKYASSHPTYGLEPSAGIQQTTKQIGDSAENEAANYLVRHGHEILKRNWKTKYCEIDIVSSKNETIYFTEVKYRKKPDQGGGMAAITAKKLNQMGFAAKFYAHSYKIKNMNLLLAVISMTGNQPEVENYLEIK